MDTAGDDVHIRQAQRVACTACSRATSHNKASKGEAHMSTKIANSLSAWKALGLLEGVILKPPNQKKSPCSSALGKKALGLYFVIGSTQATVSVRHASSSGIRIAARSRSVIIPDGADLLKNMKTFIDNTAGQFQDSCGNTVHVRTCRLCRR